MERLLERTPIAARWFPAPLYLGLALLWRAIVHLTFVTSALALAWLDRLTAKTHARV